MRAIFVSLTKVSQRLIHILITYMEIGRRIFMASRQFHNQPWKVQVKILEEDKEDFKKVLSSNELQLLQV